MEYSRLLELKKEKILYSGFDISLEELNPKLFDFQKQIVKWALRKGRCALFEDTGLGKTIQQLEFAYQVNKHINQPILILAPLAVSKQTKEEGLKFGYEVNLCEKREDVINGINITNYEKLHKFDGIEWGGVILDESSILKSFTGKTTQDMIDRFRDTPYKLCCTATPSPNDFVEIGTHSEFLNIMRRNEMLSMYFINDCSHGEGWRLKGHSKEKFFEWIATWGMMISNPEDIGFNGDDYKLPKLNIINDIINVKEDEDLLFGYKLAETLQERREARKESIDYRIDEVKKIINENKFDKVLIWCNYNDESERLKKEIHNSYEIKGSDTPEHKEYGLLGFAKNDVNILISKPSICGFGMNWQNCNNIIFCGISDSFEQFYQAIRRCWRFGQKKEVNVYIVIGAKEENILNNIIKKQENHDMVRDKMIRKMSKVLTSEIRNIEYKGDNYDPKIKMEIPGWLF